MPCWRQRPAFRTGSGQMFTYPDVMVVCGPTEPLPGRKHVLTNPVFVAEVLSPSTEAMDRGAKPDEYRATELLRQHTLISQDQPWVQLHTRDEAGSWQSMEVTGLDGECVFTGINCKVPWRRFMRAPWTFRVGWLEPI